MLPQVFAHDISGLRRAALRNQVLRQHGHKSPTTSLYRAIVPTNPRSLDTMRAESTSCSNMQESAHCMLRMV